MSFPHWQYFIAIESDLENTTKYVEIAEKNFKTYSIEYARILLSASAEVDVISKLVCQKINPEKHYNNINDYRDCIAAFSPDFHLFKITIPRYGLEIRPWENWGKGENPTWWQSYNKIKHERDKFFEEANLENVLDSVAALFSLELAYHRNLLHMTPWPKLLNIDERTIVKTVLKFKEEILQ
jgi:hypothetical protein